jgi:hypothetical protein
VTPLAEAPAYLYTTAASWAPHLGVVSLSCCGRRSVLPHDIRSDECRQQAPVGDDQRRRNCCGEGGFVRAGRRSGLVAVCCACSPVAPSQAIYGAAAAIDLELGPVHGSAGQGPDDRAVVCRRGTQLLGQRLRREAETGARYPANDEGPPSERARGPSLDAVIDAGLWPQPGRTHRCLRP